MGQVGLLLLLLLLLLGVVLVVVLVVVVVVVVVVASAACPPLLRLVAAVEGKPRPGIVGPVQGRLALLEWAHAAVHVFTLCVCGTERFRRIGNVCVTHVLEKIVRTISGM